MLFRIGFFFLPFPRSKSTRRTVCKRQYILQCTTFSSVAKKKRALLIFVRRVVVTRGDEAPKNHAQHQMLLIEFRSLSVLFIFHRIFRCLFCEQQNICFSLLSTEPIRRIFQPELCRGHLVYCTQIFIFLCGNVCRCVVAALWEIKMYKIIKTVQNEAKKNVKFHSPFCQKIAFDEIFPIVRRCGNSRCLVSLPYRKTFMYNI